MNVTHRDIIDCLRQAAPERLQESYDNSGLQCGNIGSTCSGVTLCVDVTPAVIDQAIATGSNLVISHHPLLFHSIKRVDGRGLVQEALVKAVKNDIAIYSCHTSLDNAPGGVSIELGRRLGLHNVSILDPTTDAELGTVGCGAVGTLPEPVKFEHFIDLVKRAYNTPAVRTTWPLDAPRAISRVALCGGAGSFLLDNLDPGEIDAFITSDCKYNTFLECNPAIALVDVGHFESEACSMDIFYSLIRKKFPTFAVNYPTKDGNPIHYL